MKNWIKQHMIATWALCSVLFAIIIHLLFHWETDIEILHAKWSAGDILTYASTVALGLLALWQNKRFKEENDTAQERLERLSSRANEISLINKIVELESEHLSRLRTALDEFANVCDPLALIKIFISEKKVVASEIEVTVNNVDVVAQIDYCYRAVVRELPSNALANPFFMARLDSLCGAAAKFLSEAYEGHFPDDHYYELLSAGYKEFIAQKEELLKTETKKLNRVIYETLPVSEIKKLYYDSSQKEEENPNGTHEI